MATHCGVLALRSLWTLGLQGPPHSGLCGFFDLDDENVPLISFTESQRKCVLARTLTQDTQSWGQRVGELVHLKFQRVPLRRLS